jgi:hypothetical protein
LLENAELIRSLNAAKTSAATISASLAASAELAASLEAQRSAYRPLAQAGSLLYFMLGDLAELSPMYRFSLAAFEALFRQALNAGQGEQHGAVAERIGLLQTALVQVGSRPAAPCCSNPSVLPRACETAMPWFHWLQISFLRPYHLQPIELLSCLLQLLYDHVSRALFNSDRLSFAMHMARQLHPEALPAKEWAFLLRKLAGSGQQRLQLPAWVQPQQAAGVAALQDTLPDLVSLPGLRMSELQPPAADRGGQAMPGSVAGGPMRHAHDALGAGGSSGGGQQPWLGQLGAVRGQPRPAGASAWAAGRADTVPGAADGEGAQA